METDSLLASRLEMDRSASLGSPVGRRAPLAVGNLRFNTRWNLGHCQRFFPVVVGLRCGTGIIRSQEMFSARAEADVGLGEKPLPGTR